MTTTDPIDTSAEPTVSVVGTVRAPIDKVWTLYRAFGEMDKWWHIYGFMKMLPPGRDEIGAIRNFQTLPDKNVYEERLVARDDAQRSLRYDLVSVSPSVPTLEAIATIVSMKALSADTTEVTWRSWVRAGSLVLGMIKQVQAPGYLSGIQALDRYFNPSLGKLSVKLDRADNLPQPTEGIEKFLPLNPYVLVDLDSAQHKVVQSIHSGRSPVFDKVVELDVLSREGRLTFAIFDKRLGQDRLLGHCSVDVHALSAGVAQTMQLAVQDTANATLTIEATLTLGDHAQRLAPSDEQAKLASLEKVASVVDAVKQRLLALGGNLLAPEPSPWQYDTYPIAPMPKMVKGLPRSQALSPKKVASMIQRLLEYGFSQIETPARLSQFSPSSVERYRAFFGGDVAAPAYVLDHWRDDAEFCRQMIQGLNPMQIERVTSIDRVPPVMRALTAQGHTLDQLIADKRLFILDHRELLGLEQKPPMSFYAPITLVYKERLESGATRLNVVAIQLDRDGGPLYTPNSSTPNRYLFAKMHVACADNQVHQFIWHLGLAHLGVEPMAVAAHNCLIAKNHPIGRLLAPHFADTLGINFLARQTLVAETNAITEHTFSIGTEQGVEIVSRAWKQYDFFAVSFPEQLLARGFDRGPADGLEGYRFRDDGYLLWDALGKYTLDAVRALYPSDDAVSADESIQAWAKESSSAEGAAIAGFPTAIATTQLLADCLRIVIWTASAMHSTLNYPQYPYTATPLNRAASLHRPMPDGVADIDESYLLAALPGDDVAVFQGIFSWLLSTPSDSVLTTVDAIGADLPGVLSEFRSELARMTAVIQERNAVAVAQGLPSYDYLLPANIATSINI
jgi:arachidonate 15-lipoxygenase